MREPAVLRRPASRLDSDAVDVALAPCPFCGDAARVERHPSFPGIARIACGGGEACGIRPATEYLLEEFHADGVAAWNRRGGTEAGR